MARSVKLADDVMAMIQREADVQGRSMAGQITHWVTIGRAIEQFGAFDYARITAVLEGRLDAFTEKMGQPARGEDDFHADRQALGRGVGLNACGNLLRAKDDAAT